MKKKVKVEVLATREQIGEINEGAMFADGYDDCLIGYVERFGAPPLALYDREKVIHKLMKRDGMDYDTAQEFFDFNIIGAWVGENTPAFATILTK